MQPAFPRARARRLRGLVAAAAALGAIAGAASATTPAAAEQPLPDSPDRSTWTTDGVVQALAAGDGVVYLGGGFSYVGPSTGAAVLVTPATGGLVGDPGVAGTVADAEPDGAGGAFLAGVFGAAGGFARTNLLHVLADGSVDPAFAPGGVDGPLFSSPAIHALLLDEGRLYVGGSFDAISGVARRSLAALDPADGHVLPFDLSVTDGADPGTVRALAPVAADDSVYVGGSFDRVGGAARANLARVTAAGVALSTFAGNEPNGEVRALRVAPSLLYVGGSFSRLGASAGSFLRRYGTFPATNPDGTWIPAPDGVVSALDVDGQTLYAAGAFDAIGAGGGATRDGVGAIRVADARATSWDPAPTGTISGSGFTTVNALRVVGGTVYAGGNFTAAGGEARDALVALDPVGGDAQPFDLSVGGVVNALDVTSDGKLVVAGGFKSVQGVRRRNLAALGADGRATAWNPRADDVVRALALRGGALFAGGDFDVAGGAVRHNLAALSTASGAALPFDPAPDGSVRSLALAPGGGTLFVGGAFTRLGTPVQTRPRLAALDPDSGAATAWQPQPDGSVDTLALGPGGERLYLVGTFANVGAPPQPRDGVAAVATDTGLPTPFDLELAGGGAFTALPVGGDVYLGGTFSQVSGQPRSGVAAVTAAGTLLPFDPAPVSNVTVFDIERSAGGTLLLAGGFLGLGTSDRRLLAEVDPASGLPTSWNPRLSTAPAAELLVEGRDTWVGAAPGAVDLRSSGGLLRFTRPADPPAPPGPPGPPAPPARDTAAPTIAALSLARSVFAVGSRSTAVVAARRRRAARGTTVRFVLSERASVRFEVERATPGRRSGGSCRRPGPRLRRRPACTRFVAVGAFTRRNLTAGRQSIAFSGRIGRRALSAGRHRLRLTATDTAGNRSQPRTIAFRIIRGG